MTTITYYPNGLINTIKDANNQITTYTYDDRGNRLTIQDPVNGSAQPTTFAYDSMNRVTAVTYPGASAPVQFHYDYRGRRDWVIDQNANKTTYAYDDADRLISVTDAQTPTPGVTRYGYDTENHLIDIWDAANNHTHFVTYRGNFVRYAVFPSGYQEFYDVLGTGQLNWVQDRNGNTISYWYDYQNRVVRKIYADYTHVDYTYDSAGRLTEVTDATGTYDFSYDNMGRLTGTSTQYSFLPGQTFTNSYAYDAASNRISMTAPDGSTNAYQYDALNRLADLTSSLSGHFGFAYDALSRRTQLTRPNGINTNYAYDSLSRLLSVLHQAGSTTVDGASYTYDPAGNRTSKTNQLNGITENYAYDAIYQLLQVTQGSTTTESYTYDPVGNRLSSLGVSPYAYNSSNELLSTPSLSYTYDHNGNTLTRSDDTHYAWDFDNRLKQVTLPAGGGTVTFKYDPFGRRIQKAFTQGVTSTTTNYLYDGDNSIEELDQSGNVLGRYTQTLLIDDPLAELRSGTTTYYDADGINSITSLTSATSTIAGTYVYDAFGNLSASTGSLTNPFRYTGREFDPESGLYFYRARHFDANSGRFLSEDPLGTGSDDLNGYRYVGNNPVKFMDPWGLCRIHFNGSQIMIETNNGTQRLGPFPASNSTVCNCGIPHGVYMFEPPQWLFSNGQETALGRTPFDANRDRYQAFGSARIPLDVPGRSGIMIHARHPDTSNLRPTNGCVRVHDAVVTAFSRFIDAVCTNDGPNSFHYFNSSF